MRPVGLTHHPSCCIPAVRGAARPRRLEVGMALNPPPSKHPLLRLLAEQALALALSLAALAWLYGLPSRDLRAPLAYGGDAYDGPLHAKLIIDRGWPLHHPSLGAPHGLTMHDYQRGMTLQLAAMWLLSWVAREPFLLANLYFLATFPLAAMACLAVLRHLGVRPIPALSASLLFAFLPYHHLRGMSHIFLSGYFLVPVGALLAVWVLLEAPLFGAQAEGPRAGRAWAALALAALVGVADIYYAYFTCFFLAVAGLAVAWRRGSPRAAGAAALLVGVITACALVNLWPAFLHRIEHGRNPEAGERSPWEAQAYDLRLFQMLLPVTGHRCGPIAGMKAAINRQLQGVNENDFVSLGAAGTAGLLFLLAWSLLRPGTPGGAGPDEGRRRRLEGVGLLNLAGLLLATKGGLGMLAAFVLPSIRCYNRISVFLAFFALFALAHLLEALLRAFGDGRLGRAAGVSAVLALTAAGIWDQAPADIGRTPEGELALYREDRDFARRVEEAAGDGATILQLPHCAYPECRTYGHLGQSLHSARASWSYPAMQGRYPELWQRQTSRMDVADMAGRLSWAGLAGIVWSRRLATPEEAAREEALRRLLGEPALVSASGRLAYYPLAAHAARLRAGLSPDEAERRRREALYPILVRWAAGFQQTFDDPGGRWGNARAEIHLLNQSGEPAHATLELGVHASPGGPGPLRIVGPGVDQEERLTEEPRTILVRLEVPAGRSTLRLHCGTPAHPGHARRHFHVVGYRIHQGGDGGPLAAGTRPPR